MTDAQLQAQFSSAKDDWETPQDFFDKYDAVYHFTLDAASSNGNAKCANHFTLEDDGLHKNWGAKSMAKSSIRQGHRGVGAESL